MSSWISQGILKGATGATGSTGPAGPSSVSANANNKATLGSDSLILIQGVGSGVAATTHAQTVSGDDPQLTNARTPTGHAASHASGGGDAVTIAESQVTNLATDLTAKALKTTTITAGDGMTGGGDLSANRTLSVDSTVLRSSQVDGYSLAVGAFTANVLSAPKPLYNVIEIFDEFTAYQTNVTATGTIMNGPNSWYSVLPGTTSSVISASSGTDAFNLCSGIWSLTAVATANSFARMYMPTAYTLLGLGRLDVYFRVAFFGLPTSTTSATFRMGMADTPGVVPTFSTPNSIAMIMSWASANAAPVWIGQNIKASSLTNTTFATTPTILARSTSALTFYKIQISVNAAANAVSYYVNGTQIGSTLTSNIPTGVLLPFVSCDLNTAATANAIFIDKFYYCYQIAQ